MARVAAVVVTFNRLDKLKTVIASIEAQSHAPSSLVIVDNASTDGTGDYLASLESSLDLEIVSLPTNSGGAGGFSAGMRRGYELGADFVWIMDDDGYPEPDALEKLIAGFDAAASELGEQMPFACSVVKYIDGTICEMNNPVPTWDWGRLLAIGQNSVMVTSCSFVSVLIPRWAIERYGLPYKEYFIWFDDAEYTLRLSKECAGVQVLDSVTVHDMGVNQGVNFGMIDDKNAWKFAYGIRNQASYRRHHQSLPHFFMFAAQVVVGMRRGRVKRRLQKQMIKKLWEGFRFDPQVDRVV
ncbi:glycosyl transferase [Leucobacter sp. UCD-THU]|jgi:GT2 family glycosyltransferase|uniref:glycosyltransferase family 2 protein n=1 Tax=Leucobacter sp. UCD-THU TaxID=1292023 RepID=UPI00037CF6B3|nr:glycosyltransferase family 2 protein [Leucobacter sp. UCD-THU]EYT54078.1 glycosyl transferase [Leucobacter sp. UCD-THU]